MEINLTPRPEMRWLNDPDVEPGLNGTARDGLGSLMVQAIERDDDQSQPVHYLMQPGGAFILDQPDRPVALWGAGDEVLWADAESVIIAGDQGLGKTTLAQQLALGRCGFPEYAELLGFPIRKGSRRVLYLAMDRPRQAARSFRRMVGSSWRGELDERLAVWTGPPPRDLSKDVPLLLRLAQDADADTVIVDSLKDAAIPLTDDETAARWNRARQLVLADGVQLIELHHNRKTPNGLKRTAPVLADLYGSVWVTSGAGSVLLLTGETAGDPRVGLTHLKQPAAVVGPLRVLHDHATGRSTIQPDFDLGAIVRARGTVTALEIARLMVGRDKVEPGEKQKAVRDLDKLTAEGLLSVIDEGSVTAKRAKVWGPK